MKFEVQKAQKNQKDRQYQGRDGNDFLTKKQGPQRGQEQRQTKVSMWGSENPCDGCGQANKHAYKDSRHYQRKSAPCGVTQIEMG